MTEAANQPTSATGAAFQRDRRTWAAYLLLGLFAYLETVLGPAMPFLREHLDLTYAAASLHFSAFAAGAVLMGMTGERWVQRLGRDRALWGGLAGMIAGAAIIGLGPNAVTTIAGAFLMGFLGTLSLMANQAVLADLHGDLRTIALTESNVAATGTAILAPLIIGGFATIGLGWQTGMLITVPWLLLLGWIFRDVRFPRLLPLAHQTGSAGRLPAAFWLLCVVLALLASVEWCVAYWGADFLASVVGLEQATAATAMTIFFVAMTGGRWLGSRLARHYDGLLLLLAAIAVAAAGFLIFWLAPRPAISLAGLFIAGLGIANCYPLTVAAATGAAPHLLDRATARLAVATGTALLVAPLVVGAISDVASMRWGFGIVLPLLIAALVGVIIATRWLARGPAVVPAAAPSATI